MYRVLEPFDPDFIEHQRHNNRQRKEENQIHGKQNERVLQQHKKGRLGKQPGKMLEAYPRAAGDSQKRLVILKGDHEPSHGQILKYDEVNQSGKNHEVQQPVAF
ncbi:hypothetical protein D1872_308140 [compost metagenome]